MTPESQRIAIAEACPKTIRRIEHYFGQQVFWVYYLNGWRTCINNDPLQDLNAMHEAEKIFVHSCEANKGKANWYDYWNILHDMCGRHHYSTVRATAAQRAEAFLCTLGLWKDEE